ncbi:MAG: hypothetical protein ACE5GE_05325 [Phycisphaerae bacterium]
MTGTLSDGNRRLPSLTGLTAIAIALLACIVFFARTRAYGLMGLDAYPIIIASRVQSFADLLGTVTEKLMDGRYPWDFYRPLLNATFALDHALWGLKPVGYQLTDAILFGGCSLAIYLLATRLRPGTSRIVPWAAMAFFLLHPLSVEIVPAPPRRAELLCLLLMTLALAVQIDPRRLAKRGWPPLLPGVLSLLAMAGKETGLTMPALAFAAVVIYSPRPGWVQRERHALVACLPHLTAFGIMMTARLAVLGGMGGHPGGGITKGFSEWPGTLLRVLSLIVAPQPPLQRRHLAIGLAVLALVGWMLVGFVQSRSTATVNPKSTKGTGRCHAVAFTVIWLAGLTWTTASAGRFDVWYAFMPMAAVAVLVGLATDGAVCGIRCRSIALRASGGLALSAMIALTVWLGAYSPLVHRYTEYERATAASDEFFASLATGIERTPDAVYLAAPPFPHKVTVPREQVGIRAAAILADHSLQAWADLTFPDRRIRVIAGDPRQHPPPAHDELVVVIGPIKPGFEGRFQPRLGGDDSG